MQKSEWQSALGLEKIKFYYSFLYNYFKDNPLYAELIAFLMAEKPRSVRSPKEIIDIADQARSAIKSVLNTLYQEAIVDGSIKENISNITLEAWTFNISFTFMVVNTIRYDEIDKHIIDYFVETYFARLSRK
jgi:hypothetical protein